MKMILLNYLVSYEKNRKLFSDREIHKSTSRNTFRGGEKETSEYLDFLRSSEGKMSRGEEEVLDKIWYSPISPPAQTC